ncbi:hypothetical protein TrRE_jg12426 [Triparma retinervis]|uniref:Cytochrome c oxidase assembly factor 3 mitochondrial coiled-coil domain-containing protein n=1 Tax=Triparma retinervis TaxID=2557542 RepID=A0A9W7G948_9STRA|nr:hypothetical protein TrRE_jg12426 [Triparma retinervis]
MFTTIARNSSRAIRRGFTSKPLPTEVYPPTLPTSTSVRRKNVLTAGGCVLFVTGVWYYSMQAVKGSTVDEDGMDELDKIDMERKRKINIHQSGELKVSK